MPIRTLIAVVLLLGLIVPLEGLRANTHDPLLNPGFEQASTTEYQAYDWQSFGDGYERVRYPHTGSFSIRLKNTSTTQQSGAYQRIDLQQTELKPVFVGGYVRGTNIRMAPGSWLGASMYVEVHMTDGSVAYWNSVPNFGSFNWRWIGFNTGTVSYIDKPIDHIFVIPLLGDARGTAFFDDITVEEYTPANGAVTIMIDDAEDNTYTVAKPLLDQFGMVGTSAAPVGLIGTDGYMNKEQLIELQTNGWEIVSHGINHTDLTALSPQNVRKELSNSKRYLERMGATVNSFAYPFGAYSAELNALADTFGYTSARAYELGDNPQGAYPFDIKVRSVINTTGVDEVSNWLETTKEHGRWTVLTFHSIAETGNDQYYTTPEQFEELLDLIASSGLDVITYNQGLQKFAHSKNFSHPSDSEEQPSNDTTENPDSNNQTENPAEETNDNTNTEEPTNDDSNNEDPVNDEESTENQPNLQERCTIIFDSFPQLEDVCLEKFDNDIFTKYFR